MRKTSADIRPVGDTELDQVSGGVLPWAVIIPIVLAEGAVAGAWAAVIYTENVGTLRAMRR